METFSLFGCPLAVFSDVGPAGIHARLAARLVEDSRKVPSWSASNSGGAWHSAPDLAQREEFQLLMEPILASVRQVFDALAAGRADTRTLRLRYAVQAWGVVSPSGGYATVHDHGEFHWSIACYLDAGDADMEAHPLSGAISFVDPRRVPATVAGVDLFPSTFTIRPRTAMLIVFPGWLQHYVHPYRGVRPRVALSANVRLER